MMLYLLSLKKLEIVKGIRKITKGFVSVLMSPLFAQIDEEF